MPEVTQTGSRVLDTLSRALGIRLPISAVRERVEERFGTAHYKNVHEAVMDLSDEGYLRMEKTGAANLVSLALTRMETLDLLAEVDLRSARTRREGPATIATAESRVADVLLQEPAVDTAFLVDAEPNRNLNRIELVVAVQPPGDHEERRDPDEGGEAALHTRLLGIHRRLLDEAPKATIRVDPLVLTEAELAEGMAHPGLHPAQAQASRRTALVDPQRFWWLIRRARREGPEPRMRQGTPSLDAPLDLVSPLTEDAEELGGHLDRFGYPEMGIAGEPEEEICLELVIAAALASSEPRRRSASAVLLAKNEVNPRLLAFLARKHGLSSQLLGILDALGGREGRSDLARIPPFLPDERPADVSRGRIQELLALYEAEA